MFFAPAPRCEKQPQQASKVTQGALATQIALKQSEANVVLRDTQRAAKTALALEQQLAERQKRLDQIEVEMHGAELRNRQLESTCVDVIANIEALADQVDQAKADFAKAAQVGRGWSGVGWG
jgi:hypothetical protein